MISRSVKGSKMFHYFRQFVLGVNICVFVRYCILCHSNYKNVQGVAKHSAIPCHFRFLLGSIGLDEMQ